MRLLLCSTEAPLPPLGGLRHPLRELLIRLRDNHEVTLISYLWPDQEPREVGGVSTTYLPVPARSVAERSVSFLRATAQGAPLRAVELRQPMTRQVERRLAAERFDAVHLTGLPLATLAPAVSNVPSAMVVLDAWHLNAAAEVRHAAAPLRPLKRLESANTKRFERGMLGRFDRVVTVTSDDARALAGLDPAIAPAVIPNGVDTNYFCPAESAVPGAGHDLVFVGTMSWAPNIQAAEYAAREVLPMVRRSFPQTRLMVVGRGASRATVDLLEAHSGVVVVGEVDDVRPWLREAGVTLCPMISGTGIKNKLLEALACGSPSVATPLACQGTELKHGDHLLVADDAAALARSAERLLGDRALALDIGTRGRAYVTNAHSWDAVASAYEALYAEVIRARSS